MRRVLALNVNGQLTYCTVPPEKRGVGRCNHVEHQEEGESVQDFVERVSGKVVVESYHEDYVAQQGQEFDEQARIDQLAAKLDEIAGCKVTAENLHEVLAQLPPEKVRQIAQIGFEAAPEFSLPVTDEEYAEKEVENQLYFADLPKYGIAGKQSVVEQMFVSIGAVPGYKGEDVVIKGNYKEGLTDDEYFEKLYSARASMIAKTVDVAKPGYIARKLFYALSDVHVKEDCGTSGQRGVLYCHVPGGFCAECAKADGLDVKPGTLFGAVVSTNLSEPLTQLSMREFHSGGKNLKESKQRDVINKTFDAYQSSPIIRKAKEAATTEEARLAIYEGLKEEYAKNGIAIDDYNLMVIAKKMTSFKRDKDGVRYVKEGEKCDVLSIGAIGNYNNPFKAAELGPSYKYFTKAGKYELRPDAANEIIF